MIPVMIPDVPYWGFFHSITLRLIIFYVFYLDGDVRGHRLFTYFKNI